MGLDTRQFHQFHKKWFTESVPQNAKFAHASITFNGVTSDGELVTISNGVVTEVYEFDTNASVTVGRVRVNVGGGNSAAQSVVALALAITNNSSIVTGIDGAGDSVYIASKLVGTEGNDITVAETCNNGTFGIGVSKLSGGQYCTPCACPRGFIELSDVIYYANEPCDKYSANWYSVTPILIT